MRCLSAFDFYLDDGFGSEALWMPQAHRPFMAEQRRLDAVFSRSIAAFGPIGAGMGLSRKQSFTDFYFHDRKSNLRGN